MGVTGLWTVLQPCARPIKIETLNKKRLAVDASIWIYQFLKAVRDKEGNALRNSHIVGFFRRICKLLFFGIKPVFVFDGGAPALKRQTISNRKSRREGRREDAVRTAGKLLALQMQRVAEEEEKKRKDVARHPMMQQQDEEDIPDNVVYAEEVHQTQQERQQNRKFKKKDQYHLPDLGVPLAEMGGQNDPRIMSLEELEDYARHFDRGEDINVYDFSKIDFDSPFFTSLPASDRYNILNAARLRSRLRMGYSKEQLDQMFPDRMAFSKFQIERVRERNELTQRLMNLNGMTDDSQFGVNAFNRVASERGREYVLVKNDGVEGGWALGVVTKDEGKADKPIDVDRIPQPDFIDEEWEEEEDFEDVPIEGLNRLPKPKPGLLAEDRERRSQVAKELANRRHKFYESRRTAPAKAKKRTAKPISQDPDSLFFADDAEEVDEGEGEWENVPIEGDDLFGEDPKPPVDDEEDQLRQAIALSMQQDGRVPSQEASDGEEEDVYREVFQQERAKETNPFGGARGSGLAIARLANQRSSKLAPHKPFNASESEDDDMDLQAALAESRKSKRATSPQRPVVKAASKPAAPAPKPVTKSTNAPGFDGPLPFEKLNLGSSLLGKKKMEKIEEDNAGGFGKDLGSDGKKPVEPLPPWFVGDRDIKNDISVQRNEEKEDWERSRKAEEAQYQFQKLPRLQKQDTQEVIDVDAPSTQISTKEPIMIDSDDDEDEEMEDVPIDNSTLKMGDLAVEMRVDPPKPLSNGQRSPPQQDPALEKPKAPAPFADDSEDEPIEWSESEPEMEKITSKFEVTVVDEVENANQRASKSPSEEFEDVPLQMNALAEVLKSPSPEFEDVVIRSKPTTPDFPVHEETLPVEDNFVPGLPHGDTIDDDDDQYSDPEDADLFASLAAEAEEHARFAQELNSNTTTHVNFDQELKQLRAQQKKDRRDADEVTQTMISECQHLLTLFGLPYVTAPMEAEAQCAELVSLGLVDGIVTDDSDTFLFGGTRVYKNMFNAAKFVECYLANDLTTEFSLTRDKLIAIAQLLGSDYTTGIPGIGPVTALEILSEFQDLEGFSEWWSGVQTGTISKEEDKSSQFRRRFRRTQATKLYLPPGFPNPQVRDAYLNPAVDSDPQPFQWGVPDLDSLRTFLSNQIGWSKERTDEVLVPVIKDMNRREKEGTQSNITRYFDGAVGAGAFAPRVKGGKGKRMGAALTRLAGREREMAAVAGNGEAAEGDGEVNGESAVSAGESGTKRKTRASKKKDVSKSVDGDEEEDEDEGERTKKAKA
ncbi:PIN domain-like protein [Amniculicola lignicola CBS 123094]|uniref:PIN domain-like protein n=1 Tax=Amniculicola lignicola CBS 123094 TaxID=1392246 RepID=A0A6A5W4K0_9PLEO|nr:PIN domain-like protein [Amniculicola lignicola CBS 123094]